MDSPFKGVLFYMPNFWDDDRCRSVGKFDPNNTQVEIIENPDGYGWTAAWSDRGARPSGKSEKRFRSIKDAKADLRRFLEDRDAEYCASHDPNGPPKIGDL